jgi:probable HAF family extracellular repeat protein
MTRAIRLFPLVSALCVFTGAVQGQPPARSVDSCLTLTHIWTPDFDHQLDFHVTSINDRGEIVGYGAGPHASQGAFLWRKGQFIDLGARIGHVETFAFGINDRGDVVGSYSDDGREFQAFLLRHGRVIDIQGVPGVGNTNATAVNNKRQVIVVRSEPFLWERGSAALLEPLEPGGHATPGGMNDRGIVVGVSVSPDSGGYRPALWQDGTVMDLGMPEVAESAGAVDVNNRGQVAVNVATHINERDVRLPFIWQEGEFVELPLMGDAPYGAVLTGINDQGVAVGTTSTITAEESLEDIPTVWRNRRAADLRTLICSSDPLQPYVQLDTRVPWSLINDKGQIVLRATDLRIVPWRGFYLLTPQR